jgi:malonyl-CoA/methylmalonyl-CoA synthetase
MSDNLFSTIRDSVRRPEATFIETSRGRRLSYAEVFATTGRLAHALRKLNRAATASPCRSRRRPNDPAHLACSGGRVPALSTAYTLAEMEYCRRCARASSSAIHRARRRSVTGKLGVARERSMPAGRALMETGGEGTEFDDVARDKGDLAALLYTSGTTGRSKGAMLSHDNLASNARALVETWRFTAEDVLLHALPIFHTHGLFVATNVTLFAGSSMLFLSKFEADEMFRLMPRATVMMGVPTFYTRLLQDPRLTREATRHMRLFIAGSAPLLAETHREWQARSGHAILERYGMTETNMLTSNPYEGPRVPGSVGHPLPGVELRITEPETGAPLAQGEIGMIEVKGPNVFSGYWRMPEKTRSLARRLISPRLGKIGEDGVTSSAAARISSSPAATTSIRRRSRRESMRSRAWSERGHQRSTPISARASRPSS